MAKLLDVIRSSAKPALWLDDTAYADRLLANGKTPWSQAAEFVALRRKAVGLLKPDFNVVPVGAIAHAWVSANPALKDAMSAKTRAVFPARTLLADESLRAHIVDVIQGLRAAFSSMPLVLQLPSPRAVVVQAYAMAHGADAEVEVGEDEVDSCAVYVAEFLRSFGESGVDGLLLIEEPGHEPASVDELEWYQPVINVAAHYRWDLGLQLASGQGVSGDPSGFQFVIAPQAIGNAIHGQSVDDAYWSGAELVELNGAFRFARIPSDAVPEKVLERLGAIRA